MEDAQEPDASGFVPVIRHEDPCQYSHLERYMLPLAKAQFRERQLAKKVAEFEASCREGDAASLKDIECNKIYRMPTAEETIPFRHETYTALTGHKFEE